MHQFVLTDAQWAKIEPLCLGKPTDPENTCKNLLGYGRCG